MHKPKQHSSAAVHVVPLGIHAGAASTGLVVVAGGGAASSSDVAGAESREPSLTDVELVLLHARPRLTTNPAQKSQRGDETTDRRRVAPWSMRPLCRASPSPDAISTAGGARDTSRGALADERPSRG